MKGRDKFTPDEAAAIRTLLREKARVASADQKLVRDKLRHLGFWIEEFALTNEPFRAADFDALVRNGTIKVTD